MINGQTERCGRSHQARQGARSGRGNKGGRVGPQKRHVNRENGRGGAEGQSAATTPVASLGRRQVRGGGNIRPVSGGNEGAPKVGRSGVVVNAVSWVALGAAVVWFIGQAVA
jgi:hypothetical protein